MNVLILIAVTSRLSSSVRYEQASFGKQVVASIDAEAAKSSAVLVQHHVGHDQLRQQGVAAMQFVPMQTGSTSKQRKVLGKSVTLQAKPSHDSERKGMKETVRLQEEVRILQERKDALQEASNLRNDARALRVEVGKLQAELDVAAPPEPVVAISHKNGKAASRSSRSCPEDGVHPNTRERIALFGERSLRKLDEEDAAFQKNSRDTSWNCLLLQIVDGLQKVEDGRFTVGGILKNAIWWDNLKYVLERGAVPNRELRKGWYKGRTAQEIASGIDINKLANKFRWLKKDKIVEIFGKDGDLKMMISLPR